MLAKINCLEIECKRQENLKQDFEERNKLLEIGFKQSRSKPAQKRHFGILSKNRNENKNEANSSIDNGISAIPESFSNKVEKYKSLTLPSSFRSFLCNRPSGDSPGRKILQEYIQKLGNQPIINDKETLSQSLSHKPQKITNDSKNKNSRTLNTALVHKNNKLNGENKLKSILTNRRKSTPFTSLSQQENKKSPESRLSNSISAIRKCLSLKSESKVIDKNSENSINQIQNSDTIQPDLPTDSHFHPTEATDTTIMRDTEKQTSISKKLKLFISNKLESSGKTSDNSQISITDDKGKLLTRKKLNDSKNKQSDFYNSRNLKNNSQKPTLISPSEISQNITHSSHFPLQNTGDSDKSLTPFPSKEYKSMVRGLFRQEKSVSDKSSEIASDTSSYPQRKDFESRKSITASDLKKMHETKVKTTPQSAPTRQITKFNAFTPRLSLKNHLDGVQSVEFQAENPILLSGSSDGTAKLWNLCKFFGSNMKPLGMLSPALKNIEPIYTFRGHFGMVTSVLFDEVDQTQCFTAGVDGRIISWWLPSYDNDLYREYLENSELRKMILEGHSDAIWDLCLHPSSHLLFSASSDTNVCSWKLDSFPVSINQSYSYVQDIPLTPSAVSVQHCDASKIIVGYTTGQLVQFDIETAKNICVMSDGEMSPGNLDRTSLIYHIALDRESSIAFAACDDKRIRFYDLKSAKCIHSLLAHSDSVTGIDILPSGKTIVSTSHDSSVRF